MGCSTSQQGMNEQTHDALCVNTGRPKRTDLDMSKVFVGTCPDMCPEKERYMRETRKQLSIFEVIRDTEMVCLCICYYPENSVLHHCP